MAKSSPKQYRLEISNGNSIVATYPKQELGFTYLAQVYKFTTKFKDNKTMLKYFGLSGDHQINIVFNSKQDSLAIPIAYKKDINVLDFALSESTKPNLESAILQRTIFEFCNEFTNANYIRFLEENEFISLKSRQRWKSLADVIKEINKKYSKLESADEGESRNIQKEIETIIREVQNELKLYYRQLSALYIGRQRYLEEEKKNKPKLNHRQNTKSKLVIRRKKDNAVVLEYPCNGSLLYQFEIDAFTSKKANESDLIRSLFIYPIEDYYAAIEYKGEKKDSPPVQIAYAKEKDVIKLAGTENSVNADSIEFKHFKNQLHRALSEPDFADFLKNNNLIRAESNNDKKMSVYQLMKIAYSFAGDNPIAFDQYLYYIDQELLKYYKTARAVYIGLIRYISKYPHKKASIMGITKDDQLSFPKRKTLDIEYDEDIKLGSK